MRYLLTFTGPLIVVVLSACAREARTADIGPPPVPNAPTSTAGPQRFLAAQSTATATPTATPQAIKREAVPPRPAATMGRTDCPTGWSAYEGLGISVCYPADHYAEVWSSTLFSRGLSIRLIPGEPVAFTWCSLTIRPVGAYEAPTQCLFQMETVDTSARTELAAIEVGGQPGVACRAETSYAIQYKGAIRGPDGGLDFGSYSSNSSQLALTQTILASVRFVGK